MYAQCRMNNSVTSPNGTVPMALTNGLVGTGFASRYRLQQRTGIRVPVLSVGPHPLTILDVMFVKHP